MNANLSGASPQSRLEEFRACLEEHEAARKKKKLDPDLKRKLPHGWLIPALTKLEGKLWQRWDYWFRTQRAGRLLDEPIPDIPFGYSSQSRHERKARQHWEDCLDLVPNCGRGGWKGWGSWQYVDYLFDWLLFGFGYSGQKQLPPEPHDCKGASMRLYQRFNLAIPLTYPHDYWGDLLAENRFGRSSGFYPTPMSLVRMLVQMTLNLKAGEDCQKDYRAKSVLDPCLGTGRMLLVASNYSLCLYGQDINATVLKASIINGYLYAPWLIKPFPFLSQYLFSSNPEAVSDNMTASAGQPDAAAYLENTRYDRENGWKFEPLKRRIPLKPNRVQMNALGMAPEADPPKIKPPKVKKKTKKISPPKVTPQQQALPESKD